MTDQEYATERPHEIAMAVRAVMIGVEDLCKLSELDASDKDDLVLAHIHLGRLLKRVP